MNTAGRLRTAGLAFGLTFGFALAQTGWLWLAPPILAGCLLLGVLAGEVALPRPEREARASAALEVRRVRDYLPQPATRGVVAMATALAGCFSLFVAIRIAFGGIPLDQMLDQRFFDLSGYRTVGYSDYGSSVVLSVSAVVTAAATLVVAVIVLRLLVRSPRGGADQRRRDEVWRRRTATTIIGAAGVVVSLMLVGMAPLVAMHLTRWDDVTPATLASLVPAAIGAVSLLAFAGYASMLMRPGECWARADGAAGWSGNPGPTGPPKAGESPAPSTEISGPTVLARTRQ